MAVSELLVLSVLFLALKPAISTATAGSWLPNDIASSLVPSDSSFVSLDSRVGERNWEFVEKEENVGVRENSDAIALSSHIKTQLLREFISGAEHVGALNKEVAELEKQVDRLMKDLEMQNKKKNRLGTRASVVEQRIRSLNSKLQQLYKVNDEQENRIRKFEHLLQVAEEEMKVEEETALHFKNLNKEELVKAKEDTALHSKDLTQETLMKAEEETVLPSKDLNQLCKVNEEQENRVHKTKHLLKVTEEELMKAEDETALPSEDLKQEELIKTEEESVLPSEDQNQEGLMKAEEETALHCKNMTQANGEWLPDWLYVHFDHIQLSMMSHWNNSGKSVMDLSIQKGLKTKAQVEDWIKLQTEMITVDWFPILKEQCLAFMAFLQLHIQSLTTNVINLYNVSKDSIAPHASRIQKDLVSYAQERTPRLKELWMEFVTHLKWYIQLFTAMIMDMYSAFRSFIAPRAFKTMEDLGFYAQKTKNFTESYMQQTAIVSRSQLDKVYVMLKSSAIEALHACGQFSKASISYHHRVQEMLKNNELVRPLANLELAWFVATTLLLAVPALFILILYSALIRKKTMKQSQNLSTRRRKAKTTSS